ncbi:MAG: helix-turn-helix transcriptional regulator [Clostridia bacterium]|nr:helix-turn-helix transcriptional regulator [Clostridia bacterium]
MYMVRLTIDKYLDRRGITRYELAKRTEVKFQTIDRYYKNRVVRYDSYILDRICSALECNLSDILEYTKDGENLPSAPSTEED